MGDMAHSRDIVGETEACSDFPEEGEALFAGGAFEVIDAA